MAGDCPWKPSVLTDPHLLLDAAEVDGEAELVILHRRARDRRRPRRQRAVHLQEIAGRTQACHAAELTPVACRTTLVTVRCGEAGKRVRRNSTTVSTKEIQRLHNSVVNYLVNDRQERARWLAQNSFGLHSQVNKNKFM